MRYESEALVMAYHDLIDKLNKKDDEIGLLKLSIDVAEDDINELRVENQILTTEVGRLKKQIAKSWID